MEFYSPQPEHAQLNTGGNHYNPKTNASHLLGLLHQQVQDAAKENRFGNARSDGEDNNVGIDAVLEENAILSPPLSPEPEGLDEEYEYVLGTLNLDESSGEEQQESILVNPSWTPGLSPRIYRHSTHGFLSEYRVFQNVISNSERQQGSAVMPSSHSRTLRRARVYKPTGSEYERISRTRRMARNFSEDEHSETELEIRRPSTPRRTKRSATYQHQSQLTSPLASAKAVHSIPQYVPNMSWEKLPDYSPSVATLPSNNVKCLKVEWKGSPMDLSNDPLKGKLHPAELILAQVLRLPCDLYLDSKRRLFLEKTHRLQQGLPFRRTDAQKACRIDVNKASRLYAAFEKVGWLNDSNFKKFL
ncbi:hypothetical protein HG535_0E02600 [Zygotorulaspora mrakii]|uniref:SWIRM domain-containing protein n=1 Tax=Zygotorulaspora mrakii TaxID=42260 RepID=A0A7H9B478_ZYGMR|nr:uncharacterized protein HG535_0E02600 [Zygotorulaspora mrakii]QLG73176.1 hypothetical protein HG535_0E02600 [Zygotorulaspora mrakii]